jgi:hypothetical protein
MHQSHGRGALVRHRGRRPPRTRKKGGTMATGRNAFWRGRRNVLRLSEIAFSRFPSRSRAEVRLREHGFVDDALVHGLHSIGAGVPGQIEAHARHMH